MRCWRHRDAGVTRKKDDSDGVVLCAAISLIELVTAAGGLEYSSAVAAPVSGVPAVTVARRLVSRAVVFCSLGGCMCL